MELLTRYVLLLCGFSSLPALSQVRTFELKGVSYRAELRRSDSKPLQVYRGENKVAEDAKREWKPWRLEVADVDGDGSPDLAVGVLKPTRHMSTPHTTLFVYGFDGKRITKKWLGSTLGRPLVDFCFGAPDGPRKGAKHAKGSPEVDPAPLYTLERTLKGGIALSRSEWSGFGFQKVSRDVVWKEANELSFERGKIVVAKSGKRVEVDPKELK